MIIENDYFEDIQRIWKENNKGYITYESNQIGINDNKMLKLVWRENNITMAYAIICFDRNFCEKEDYLNNIKDMPDKVAYIWAIVTNKEYTGKGIASKLINYVIDKYKNFTIYSCINLTNIQSLKLHKKNGFETLYEFTQNENNKTCSYSMMSRKGEEK